MSNVGKPRTAAEIQQDWDTNPRWKGITRDYTAAQVEELQGSVVEENTLARRGAEILWDAVSKDDDSYINALGALTGNMAVQQVRAGLKAIYLSGWQVAGDANLSGHTYPDQSLYPANSVPVGSPHQQRPAACRRDRPRRGRHQCRQLARADRR